MTEELVVQDTQLPDIKRDLLDLDEIRRDFLQSRCRAEIEEIDRIKGYVQKLIDIGIQTDDNEKIKLATDLLDKFKLPESVYQTTPQSPVQINNHNYDWGLDPDAL